MSVLLGGGGVAFGHISAAAAGAFLSFISLVKSHTQQGGGTGTQRCAASLVVASEVHCYSPPGSLAWHPCRHIVKENEEHEIES